MMPGEGRQTGRTGNLIITPRRAIISRLARANDCPADGVALAAAVALMLHRPASSWGKKEGTGWKLGSGKSRLFTKADLVRQRASPLEGTRRCCGECVAIRAGDVLHFNIVTQEEKQCCWTEGALTHTE